MRRPRGQSAYLRGRPAHSTLKRAELSETTGGVARQVGAAWRKGAPAREGMPATQAGSQTGGLLSEVRRDQDVRLVDMG